MKTKQEKVVGIIGGMGPEATVDLMQRIIKNTSVTDDVDHVRCIVDNNPKIPSRIKALLENSGENPGAHMADMGKRLESYGADFLAIPCNTAHNYHKDVVQAVKIPVLNMVDLAVEAAKKRKPDLELVGILATPMVRITQLYEKKFAEYGVEVLYPDAKDEERLFATIREIKAGKTGSAQLAALEEIRYNLIAKGAQLCVLACTELGVMLQEDSTTVDAAEVLAKEIVSFAKGQA